MSKGRGWHGDSEAHARIGKLGGEAVKSKRGREFFSEIGRKGGRVSPTRFASGSQRAKEAGQKGGMALHRGSLL